MEINERYVFEQSFYFYHRVCCFWNGPRNVFWYSKKNQKLLGLGRVSDFSFILLRSGFGFFDFFLPLLRIIQFFSKNCYLLGSGRAGQNTLWSGQTLGRVLSQPSPKSFVYLKIAATLYIIMMLLFNQQKAPLLKC